MLKPVIVLGEMFYGSLAAGKAIHELLPRLADHSFYQGVEAPMIEDRSERTVLRECIRQIDLELMLWTTYSLQERGLDLAHEEASERRKALAFFKQCADCAVECGAVRLATVSGGDPGAGKRADKIARFTESLHEAAEYMQQYGLELVLESLDRDVHKKKLVGPTPEAIEVIHQLRNDGMTCSLCWDSAHIALLGEDLAESLSMMNGYMSQIHFSDAVLAPNDPAYGDWHQMVGTGFLTKERAAGLLKHASAIGAKERGLARVAVEIRSNAGDDAWVNEAEGRKFLQWVLRESGESEVGDL